MKMAKVFIGAAFAALLVHSAPVMAAESGNTLKIGMTQFPSTLHPDFDEMVARAAGMVKKLLDGAKPGDLPFEQPTKFELAINTRTAKALGLAIPKAMLQQANVLIE